MPRRATRARRIKLELDIEVTIIFVFANSFSQIRFEVWWWSRELRGQPDNTPRSKRQQVHILLC
jgi:hypothetical protein